MKMTTATSCALAALLMLASLTGCGGDEQSVRFAPPPAKVHVSYPTPNQDNVSVSAPVVLRVSDIITNIDELDDEIQLLKGDESIPVNIEVAGGSDGRSLVIRPQQPLAPASQYRLQVGTLATLAGDLAFPGGGFDFTTRAADRGPRSERVQQSEFALERMLPDGEDLPLMDFSALRLQFSQPLNQRQAIYGDADGPEHLRQIGALLPVDRPLVSSWLSGTTQTCPVFFSRDPVRGLRMQEGVFFCQVSDQGLSRAQGDMVFPFMVPQVYYRIFSDSGEKPTVF